MIDLAKLKAPFPPDRISWRVGSTNGDKTKGMALGYIDARDVMERLDDVCGPGGWQCSYPHANGKTVCAISIKIGDEWVSKADGAGDTDFEAEKGALSDAFKRAAVRWGIGRYLYDLAAPWVAIEQRGKSYIIKESEYGRLRAVLGNVDKGAPAATPDPGDRTNAEVYTEAALAIIKSGLYVDRANAVSWFNGEKETRRKHGLTQGHVDLLLSALNETYPQKKDAA